MHTVLSNEGMFYLPATEVFYGVYPAPGLGTKFSWPLPPGCKALVE
jgi:hypothetical protein